MNLGNEGFFRARLGPFFAFMQVITGLKLLK